MAVLGTVCVLCRNCAQKPRASCGRVVKLVDVLKSLRLLGCSCVVQTPIAVGPHSSFVLVDAETRIQAMVVTVPAVART